MRISAENVIQPAEFFEKSGWGVYNRVFAQRKGPSVTNQSVGPVRTADISWLWSVNTVSHNPAPSSSDNIPS